MPLTGHGGSSPPSDTHESPMSDGHYRLISRDRQHQIMEALLISAWQNGSPRIGDVAEMRRTVTATDIERFTEISGDRNPCTTTSRPLERPGLGRLSFKAALPAPSSMRWSRSSCQGQARYFSMSIGTSLLLLLTTVQVFFTCD